MHRTRTLSLAASVVILAAALIYALLRFFLPPALKPIVLPTPDPVVSSSEPGRFPPIPAERRDPIEVSRENVLALLTTLDRPSDYTAEWEIRYRWPGGGSSAGRRVWARDAYVKTEWTDETGRIVRHVLTGGGWTFTWQEGDTDFTVGSGDDPDGQNGLAAYEPLSALAPDRIRAAGYLTEEEEPGGRLRPVLRIETGDPPLGVTTEYRIELDTGLLLSAEITDGAGSLAVRRLSVSLERPGDEPFRLPDGRLAWDAASEMRPTEPPQE